jgi:nucleoside-diphosphate-sugar epimerase
MCLCIRFIATECALVFMEAGYTVKGTVRSKDKADGWIASFPQYKDRFQYAIVPDMVAPGSYDEAVKGCDYVVHTASPAALNPKVRIRLRGGRVDR